MHQRLLPASEALDQVNAASLDRAYKGHQAASDGIALVSSIVGGCLLAVLVYVQVFLFRVMRRVLNPPLLAATVVCFAFSAYLVTHMAMAREDLRVAKEDAFESIHALWKASAIAYDANGDETRYLLTRSRARVFETAYRTKVAKLTSSPHHDLKSLLPRPPQDFNGLFADELRNITFAGEGEAALAMVQAFAKYDTVDGQIRQLEAKDNNHAAAVALCVGTGANESNGLFAAFDTALKHVIKINKDQFDRKVNAGRQSVALAWVLSPIASLAIALLAYLGIRARLREYEV
jgi:hypothetical protein